MFIKKIQIGDLINKLDTGGGLIPGIEVAGYVFRYAVGHLTVPLSNPLCNTKLTW